MKLFTKAQLAKMLANGKASAECEGGIDHLPVVKLFTPDASATWLLSEIDPDTPDIVFGLCDLGLGFPELGSVLISELMELRGKLGLLIERDRFFNATKSVGKYADDACRFGRIVTEVMS